jgi:tetratricopeptide (TPR) repeat protein
MKKQKTHARDPLEQAIEKALLPGSFISYGASHGFVSGLERVASEIEKIVLPDGARAARLYEIFIAACYEKAGELDDSGGNLGMFVEDLFCGWVRARVRERANPDETAKTLLEWMDKDEYGFCHGLEREVVKAFDKEGLAAFAREVREALVKGDDDTFGRQRRGEILRAIYLQQQDLDAYVSFCEKSGLSAKDCLAIAEMLKARRKFDEALAWVQRGLTLNRKGPDYSGGEFDLDRMKRNLLSKLGRAGEAVDEAWSEFQKHPSIFRYEELMRFVPKAERATWHERAMNAANGGDLGSLIELWLKTKEIDRLVCRLRKTADAEIEDLSHYTTEPAAKRLAKAHPDVAARIYRALGMRILNAKKSKYYDAALSNFQDAKRCYERAGLAGDWQAVVAEVRQAHYRKVGFMDGFEKLVAGHGPSDEPSFLERARTRWLRRERS